MVIWMGKSIKYCYLISFILSIILILSIYAVLYVVIDFIYGSIPEFFRVIIGMFSFMVGGGIGYIIFDYIVLYMYDGNEDESG